MSFHEKKVVIKSFVVFCFGIFLNYSGYLVFYGLQSSINIKDGVGIKTIFFSLKNDYFLILQKVLKTIFTSNKI